MSRTGVSSHRGLCWFRVRPVKPSLISAFRGRRWNLKDPDPTLGTTRTAYGPSKPSVHDLRSEDRRKIVIVSFSHAVQHSYVAMLGIAYPFVLASFHQTYAALGIVLGIAGVSSGLLQGLATVVRKLSARLLLGAQNLILALTVLIAAASPGLVLFGTARVLGSLSSWAQHPVGSAYVAEHFPKNRGKVLSYLTTGGNVGTLIAPLIGGVLIATVGWRWALSVFAIPLVASGLWTLTRLAQDPPVTTSGLPTNGTEPDEQVPRASSHPIRPSGEVPPNVAIDAVEVSPPTGRRLGEALRRREAIAVLAAGMVSGAGRGLGVLTTYVPAYLRTGLHLSPITVGFIVTVVSVGAVCGPLVAGRLSDSIGRRPVLFSIYLFGAAALIGFVFVGTNAVVLGAMGVALGVFAYSEQPIRQALFQDSMHGIPARQVFGVYFAISQSVGALWITVLGFLITDVSFRAAFTTMAGSFVVAGTIIALLARQRDNGQDEPVA